MTEPVVIIGGGIIGSCTAYFLAPYYPAVVLERDPSYRFASTTLSAASFRQQFSFPVNLHMSRFGSHFLEERADRVGLVRRAYLVLATEAGAAQLKANRAMQVAEGAKVALFEGPRAIAERFPWLNVEDLACATLGLADEGWFDAYSLLQSVKQDAIARGARYLADEAVQIEITNGRAAAVKTARGERIAASHVVIAAGRHAGRITATAGVALPVEPRKRTVFVLKAPLDNAGGAWIRPEGDGFIGGISPPPDNDPDPGDDFDPDLDLLEEEVWPKLAHRIPALERLRMMRAWAGHYDMCLLDRNAVIGPHPEIAGLIIAAGFSGHGVQHGPATGRALAELVRFGEYRSLDLGPLGYERVRDNRPMPELEVY
jgi:FAD-dependent oxidoreductase domain-containing protein 1